MITHEFRGIKFHFNESPQIQELVNEIFSDNYKVFYRNLSIRPGDVILDIGACEGVFSIMMGKVFPDSRVISFEPVRRTFFQFMRNLGLNGANNVEAVNMGVGKEPGTIPMAIGQSNWSGGSSGVMTFNPALHEMTTVDVITLDEVFERHKIDRCRLLKMDIEGMEYDALYGSKVLDRVDYMVGEFHINQKLQERGRDISELATWVGEKTNLIYFERCRMAE